MSQSPLEAWHRIVSGGGSEGLDAILDDSAVFHSPVVHTPQEGRELTSLYLRAAAHVLGGSGFRYVREVVGANDAVLEFETELEGIHINGVDMIRWNDDGLITDFKVMIRPLKAINLLHRLMGEMLTQGKPG